MSAERATYVDSSAILKLVVDEAESSALRRYLARRKPLVVSALATTEVARALLALSPAVQRRGEAALGRLELIRLNDRILRQAGRLRPAEVRSLDAIHLATAQELGRDLARLVTYDARMSEAAVTLGLSIARPR